MQCHLVLIRRLCKLVDGAVPSSVDTQIGKLIDVVQTTKLPILLNYLNWSLQSVVIFLPVNLPCYICPKHTNYI